MYPEISSFFFVLGSGFEFISFGCSFGFAVFQLHETDPPAPVSPKEFIGPLRNTALTLGLCLVFVSPLGPMNVSYNLILLATNFTSFNITAYYFYSKKKKGKKKSMVGSPCVISLTIVKVNCIYSNTTFNPS